MQGSWEGAEGDSGSINVGQEREKQNTVLTGGWTETWPGPCTAGVSDPRPWSSRQEETGPREHPRKVGRGRTREKWAPWHLRQAWGRRAWPPSGPVTEGRR